MKQSIKRTVKKIAPGLTAQMQRLLRVDNKLEVLEQKIDDINKQLSTHDFRIDRLKALAAKVEPYQPAYNVSGVIEGVKRDSVDRCVAIEQAIQPIVGKRILDIGSSLGYVSFYLADRGALVEGWEYNVDNTEVARLIGEINGIDVDFKVKELNHDTADAIPPGRFDVVLVLNVFHHITYYHGLEYTKQLVQKIMDRIPVAIVELAKKGEDKNLFWDAAQPDDETEIFDLIKDEIVIKKIGDLKNHLSNKTRPLYLVVKKNNSVSVGNHTYAYEYATAEAYKNSPVARNKTARRKYYFAQDYIVKEYDIGSDENPDNLYQIINEINTMINVIGRRNVYHAPKLLDFEVKDRTAKIVVERIKGDLLSDLSSSGALSSKEIKRVVRDVLHTLADLEKCGIHHNDVRSWNIVYSPETGAWLIDYGYAGPESTDDDITALLWMLRALERGERETYEQGKLQPPRPTDFEDNILRRLCKLAEKGVRSPAKLLNLLKETEPKQPQT